VDGWFIDYHGLFVISNFPFLGGVIVIVTTSKKGHDSHEEKDTPLYSASDLSRFTWELFSSSHFFFLALSNYSLCLFPFLMLLFWLSIAVPTTSVGNSHRCLNLRFFFPFLYSSLCSFSVFRPGNDSLVLGTYAFHTKRKPPTYPGRFFTRPQSKNASMLFTGLENANGIKIVRTTSETRVSNQVVFVFEPYLLDIVLCMYVCMYVPPSENDGVAA
jgi:hypothetical protein